MLPFGGKAPAIRLLKFAVKPGKAQNFPRSHIGTRIGSSRTDNFPAVAHAPMVSTSNPPTLRYISHPTTTESSSMNASTPIDPPAPSPADPPPNPLPPVPPKEEPPTPHPHSPPPRTPEPSDPQKAPTHSPGGPGDSPISEPPIPGRTGDATS